MSRRTVPQEHAVAESYMGVRGEYSLEPMEPTPRVSHAPRLQMPLRTEIPLCVCLEIDVDGHRFAVLDELKLTYDVVERQPGGRTRVLQKHVATLREARAYGCEKCGRRSRAGPRDSVTQR